MTAASLISSSHCSSFLILLYRIFCLLTLQRGTRCLCMCCLGRWTPVSTRPSLRVVQRIVCCPCGWITFGMLNILLLVLMPGPVVGEFPAQNDVNLAPAPSLPQVTHFKQQHSYVRVVKFLFLHWYILYVLCIQPVVVQDMTEFKRSLPLFPLAKPHINFMAAKLWSHHLQCITGFDLDTQHSWV